jgi:hypothetical protein
MVAEPMFLRNLGELGQSPVSQLCASTATNILIQEKRLQLCLFSDLHPDLDEDELAGWACGAPAPSIRRALICQMRNRGVRHRDLAEAIGLSRPQLTNVLRGRFGTAPARVEALKRILEVWVSPRERLNPALPRLL